MSGARSSYFTLCEREIHVTQWGERHRPALVLWHGLARTGRDFDTLAAALADDYFILAPDTLGRGLSQWAKDPAAEYTLGNFGRMAEDLLDQLNIKTCRWVGTSMGGAIGMHVAGGRLRERISHLVINDIGPELAPSAVERIINYVGRPPRFETIAELEAWLRQVYAPYGHLSAAEWRQMAETSSRRKDDGGLTLHYDPRIVAQFEANDGLGDQWADYDAITARTLLLRGTESDLLTPALADEMTRRGPKAKRVDVDGVGHAPALNVPGQTDLVRDWLG